MCNDGYYVDYHGRCVENPLPAIPNCNKYTSATVCVDCKQGHFLESSSKCAMVTPLINCLLYNTNTPYSSCKKCIDEYYLDAENICKPRTVLSSINFCDTLADVGERCEKCFNGYHPTDDELKCLPIVENCSVYVKSTINSLRLECSVCNDGYYFNTTYKVCARGTVENCKSYNRTTNQCSLCESNFYLVSNTCLPHTQLPSCIDYSTNQADTCTQCKPFTFLFSSLNTCVAVDDIKNCKTYGSKTTCAVCQDGYYLYNPSECRVIPPEYNCVHMDGNLNCIKCLPQYVLR